MRGAGNAPTALPRMAAAGWLRPPTSDRTPPTRRRPTAGPRSPAASTGAADPTCGRSHAAGPITAANGRVVTPQRRTFYDSTRSVPGASSAP
jgi:hypothetical protein